MQFGTPIHKAGYKPEIYVCVCPPKIIGKAFLYFYVIICMEALSCTILVE